MSLLFQIKNLLSMCHQRSLYWWELFLLTHSVQSVNIHKQLILNSLTLKGEACKTHNEKSFAGAWGKSVNPKSAVFISSIITFKTFFACLAYSIIIGDSFSQIFKSFGLSDVLSGRNNVIIGLTTAFIFPLCCLKKLDALKYTSILGLIG